MWRLWGGFSVATLICLHFYFTCNSSLLFLSIQDVCNAVIYDAVWYLMVVRDWKKSITDPPLLIWVEETCVLQSQAVLVRALCKSAIAFRLFTATLRFTYPLFDMSSCSLFSGQKHVSSRTVSAEIQHRASRETPSRHNSTPHPARMYCANRAHVS